MVATVDTAQQQQAPAEPEVQILLKAQTATIGVSLISAIGGNGSVSGSGNANGGNGGAGRIRIEYSTLSGSTNPAASTQQVNFFSMTGSTTTTLYLPDDITNGSDIRYQLLYGQRSYNTEWW